MSRHQAIAFIAHDRASLTIAVGMYSLIRKESRSTKYYIFRGTTKDRRFGVARHEIMQTKIVEFDTRNSVFPCLES